jgi:hypothetical protein
MLGRSIQTSQLIVNQAGTRPITFYDEIFPQNNQVLDAGYGQSVAGQVPLHTYKPYYPKIETVVERKITPQDIFRAQNKQVQKIVSAPNLKGYGNRFINDLATTPKVGKSDQSSQTPNVTQTRDQTVDDFKTASQGSVSVTETNSTVSIPGSEITTEYETGSSLNSSRPGSESTFYDDMMRRWNALLNPTPTSEIIKPSPVTQDDRVEIEIEDDQYTPTVPGLWNETIPIVFGKKQPEMSQPGKWNQQTPIVFSDRVKQATKRVLSKIPQKVLQDQGMQTDINTLVNDIANEEPRAIIEDDILILNDRWNRLKYAPVTKQTISEVQGTQTDITVDPNVILNPPRTIDERAMDIIKSDVPTTSVFEDIMRAFREEDFHVQSDAMQVDDIVQNLVRDIPPPITSSKRRGSDIENEIVKAKKEDLTLTGKRKGSISQGDGKRLKEDLTVTGKRKAESQMGAGKKPRVGEPPSTGRPKRNVKPSLKVVTRASPSAVKASDPDYNSPSPLSDTMDTNFGSKAKPRKRRK